MASNLQDVRFTRCKKGKLWISRETTLMKRFSRYFHPYSAPWGRRGRVGKRYNSWGRVPVGDGAAPDRLWEIVTSYPKFSVPSKFRYWKGVTKVVLTVPEGLSVGTSNWLKSLEETHFNSSIWTVVPEGCPRSKWDITQPFFHLAEFSLHRECPVRRGQMYHLENRLMVPIRCA